MSEKHSAVCYIFREGAFTPVQEAKPLRNEFNLDLFQYKGAVYEGKTGLRLCPVQDAEYLSLFIRSHGGKKYGRRLRAVWSVPVFLPAIPDRMKRKRTSFRPRKKTRTGSLPKT